MIGTARPRPALRRGDRPPGRRRRSPASDAAVETQVVDRPISPAEVRRVASKGYPLWESMEVMRLRNARITVAYADLSDRLATLLTGGGDGDGDGDGAAGDAGERDANWCTFASWSSRTIGTWIETDAVPEPLRELKRVPRFVVSWLVAATRYLIQRENGASYRCLAAGNRFVFLEIGLGVACFLETFEGLPREEMDEDRWAAYWAGMERSLAELARLDPSWLLTEAPEPADLELGLRQYYEALHEPDRKLRAELILAGNTLIGAYEQRRVDGYVSASLALFTARAMRQLVQHRSGRVKGVVRRWLTIAFARLMTRGLVLNTYDEQFRVGRPLPPPGGPGTPIFPPDLQTPTMPLLQALLTRYDLSAGDPRGRRARDWTSFDDRMNYITNLFRSRQQHPVLFTPRFPPEVEQALLEGRLEGSTEGPSTPDAVPE
jgi:hypothetical protein